MLVDESGEGRLPGVHLDRRHRLHRLVDRLDPHVSRPGGAPLNALRGLHDLNLDGQREDHDDDTDEGGPPNVRKEDDNVAGHLHRPVPEHVELEQEHLELRRVDLHQVDHFAERALLAGGSGEAERFVEDGGGHGGPQLPAGAGADVKVRGLDYCLGHHPHAQQDGTAEAGRRHERQPAQRPSALDEGDRGGEQDREGELQHRVEQFDRGGPVEKPRAEEGRRGRREDRLALGLGERRVGRQPMLSAAIGLRVGPRRAEFLRDDRGLILPWELPQVGLLQSTRACLPKHWRGPSEEEP